MLPIYPENTKIVNISILSYNKTIYDAKEIYESNPNITKKSYERVREYSTREEFLYYFNGWKND